MKKRHAEHAGRVPGTVTFAFSVQAEINVIARMAPMSGI
jgi:hypothetical protein